MTNTKVPMIVEGNAFKGIVPLYYATSGTKVPLDAALISNLTIRISKSGVEVPDIPFITAEHRVIIGFNEKLTKGAYSVEILGDVESLGLRYAKKLGFQIVGWNEQSNFDGLVCGMDVPLEDALFILSASGGEIEELEERLREAIAEAQAAKEEYIRKAGELTDVAHETNATQNKEEVIQAIGAIPQPVIPTDYAKEVTLTTLANSILEEIRTKVAELKTWLGTQFTTLQSWLEAHLSGVAKETNATENKEEILRKIGQIPAPDLSSVAKEQTLLDGVRDIERKIEQIPKPDLSSVAKEATLQGVSDKVGTFTDPTETVAHKLENLTFDKTDLAKEATTAKQGNDITATNTAIKALLQEVLLHFRSYNKSFNQSFS